MILQKKQGTGGYVAISTVVVILAVVILIAMSVSLVAVNGLQSTFQTRTASGQSSLVHGCVAEALLELNTQNMLPNSITFPEGSCDITEISQNGSEWQFAVTLVDSDFDTQVTVTANRGERVTITSWSE